MEFDAFIESCKVFVYTIADGTQNWIGGLFDGTQTWLGNIVDAFTKLFGG